MNDLAAKRLLRLLNDTSSIYYLTTIHSNSILPHITTFFLTCPPPPPPTLHIHIQVGLHLLSESPSPSVSRVELASDIYLTILYPLTQAVSSKFHRVTFTVHTFKHNTHHTFPLSHCILTTTAPICIHALLVLPCSTSCLVSQSM